MSAIELVATDSGEARVDSETIAAHAEVEHRAVLQLLGSYEADFAEFGTSASQMRKSAGRPTRVVFLNEDQATLLLTYLRNTDAVRRFKKDLVRAFSDARNAVATPALTEDQIVAQALQITVRKVEALEAQVAELETPARAWQHLASTEGDLSVGDAAKTLSRDHGITIGQGRLFKLLLTWKWTYRDHDGQPRPYQTAVDAGRLATRARSHHHPRTGELVMDAPQIRVTAKGLEAILRRLTIEVAS